MKNNLRMAVIFATLTLVWNLYGFAGNFFEHYWGQSLTNLPVTFISFVVNALLLIGISLNISGQYRAVKLLTAFGVLMALWSLGGTIIELAFTFGRMSRDLGTPPLNFPQPPPLLGPLLPMITGTLTAVFGWKSLYTEVGEK
jgi:hypothetical protein